MAFRKAEFNSAEIIVDPNLGIYADGSALSDQQYYLYKSRHIDKTREYARLDLLPYQQYKFNRDLKLAEYFLISQREKVMRQYTRFNLLYTSPFVTSHLEPFLPTLVYTTHPYLQTLMFNYYRSKNDASNLVNYIRRTMRKLSNYGFCDAPEGRVIPLPFEENKKRAKNALLKNAEKIAEKLRASKQTQ